MRQDQSRIVVAAVVLSALTGFPALAAPSKATREAANSFAFRSVNRVGCDDFESFFERELKPQLDFLRKRGDAGRSYIKNLVWDYSKRRYGNFGSKYQVSSKALIELYSGYLESGQVNAGTLRKIAGLGKSHGIRCGGPQKQQADSSCKNKVDEALQGLSSINLMADDVSKGENSSCVPEESSKADYSGRTDKLVRIAMDGTTVVRNSKRQETGPKESTQSIYKCGMYVSIALEGAGCQSPGGPRFQEEGAKDLGRDLKANGFKNLMLIDGVLPDGMETLYDAPVGSVLIFDGGDYGHAEIVGKPGFISDYWSSTPRTGAKGPPEGRGRRLIGIWVKPSCGAGS